MRICRILILLFLTGLSLNAAELKLKKSADLLEADNGKIVFALRKDQNWNPAVCAPSGEESLIRDIKLLEFLHPTAVESKTVPVSADLKETARGACFTVCRNGSEFDAEESITLPKDSDTADVRIRIRMKQPLKVGILRMPVLTASAGADAVLFSDERELAKADTAGSLENLGNGYDFYYGVADSASKSALLILMEGNREKQNGIFKNYRKEPGRLRIGFELYKGPFGELRDVKPGDTFEFRFQLLLTGADPEAVLNNRFPGASVRRKREQGLDEPIRVFFDPAFYRDDRRMFLLGDFPNPAGILFYRRTKNDFDAKNLKLLLDLPEHIRLEKAVIFNYWIPRNIASEFRTEQAGNFRRYHLEAPSPITFVADKTLFDSLKHHQLYLFLRTPHVEKETPFTYRWQLVRKGEPSGELHTEQGVILPRPGNIRVPRRISLWLANAPMRHLVWADSRQLAEFIALFQAQGIRVLQEPETAPYMKPQFPDLTALLKENGFRIHRAYGPLRPLAEKNLKHPAPGSLWTTLNGKQMYQGNNPQLSFCPSYLLRRDTPLHAELKQYFSGLKQTDFMWNDWEGKTFDGCYCPECRKSFAAFLRIPVEPLQSLTPLELARKYPLEWIRFRHRQSADMFRLFKEMGRKSNPKIRSGMDFHYTHLDTSYPGLGRGSALFCEDPRMMKNADFDFVLPDSLHSGPTSYDQVKVCCDELQLPVIPKTGSVGGLAFYAGSWVSRRMLADFQRRPLGLDLWPRLARTAALGHASSGTAGILLEGAPLDALTQLEYLRLAKQLAVTENDYLDGQDRSADTEFYDIPIRTRTEKDDDTLAASWIYLGRKPEQFWRSRVHENNGRVLISFFNFDLAHRRTIRIVLPPELRRAELCLYNPETMTRLLSPSGREYWTPKELSSGIPVSADKADAELIAAVPIADAPPALRKTRKTEMPSDRGIRITEPPLKNGKLEHQLETYLFLFPFGGL